MEKLSVISVSALTKQGISAATWPNQSRHWAGKGNKWLRAVWRY